MRPRSSRFRPYEPRRDPRLPDANVQRTRLAWRAPIHGPMLERASSSPMNVQKGDQELVRAQNRALEINRLRLHGTLSRSEIAACTGLGASAMTSQVRELLYEGVVVETGRDDATGGRPAVLASLNRDGHAPSALRLSEPVSSLRASTCAARCATERRSPLRTRRHPSGSSSESRR